MPERGSRWVFSNAGDLAHYLLVSPGIGITVGAWDGICRAFGLTLTPEKQRQLRGIIDFIHTAPDDVKTIVQEKIAFRRLSPEQIVILTSHDQWISALRSTRDFGAPATGQPDEAFTPRAIIDAMSSQQRQDLFLRYVDKFFEAARADPSLATSLGTNVAPANRFSTTFSVDTQRDVVLDAMRGMIGVHPDLTVNSAAYTMARRGLDYRYFQMNAGGNHVGRQTVLNQDYDRARYENPGRDLSDQLRDVAPSGFFRGALRLGVVRDADLTAMLHQGGPMTQLTQERANVFRRTALEMNQYLGITRAEVNNRMRAADSIPTWVFWVLGGLGLYNRSTRGWTAGIGTILGLMYLNGFEAPHRDALHFLGGLAGIGTNRFLDFAGGYLPGVPGRRLTNADIDRRAESISKFLSEHARARLEASTGMGMLTFMRIRDIAAGYTPPPEGQTVGTFDPNRQLFRVAARSAVTANVGMNESAITRAFNDGTRDGATNRTIGQRNREEVRTAMENICFLMVKERGTFDQKHRVALVDAALAALPEGQRTYQQITDNNDHTDPRNGSTYRPRDLYYEIVREGHALALQQEETLGDLITRHIAVPPVQNSQQEITEKAVVDQIAQRKRELEGLIPSGVAFSVNVNGPNVVFGIPSHDNLQTTVSLPGQSFANTPAAQLLTQWRTAIASSIPNINTLRGGLPIGDPLPGIPEDQERGFILRNTFAIRQDGDFIQYTNRNIAAGPDLNHYDARSPAFKFWAMSPNAIHRHYVAWRRKDATYRAAHTDALDETPII